eukprot:1186507-Prorocentrum_minimum.AAC.4
MEGKRRKHAWCSRIKFLWMGYMRWWGRPTYTTHLHTSLHTFKVPPIGARLAPIGGAVRVGN